MWTSKLSTLLLFRNSIVLCFLFFVSILDSATRPTCDFNCATGEGSDRRSPVKTKKAIFLEDYVAFSSAAANAIWLSGSLNTVSYLTQFCYDEGDVFSVTCNLHVDHDLGGNRIYLGPIREEVGIIKELRSSSRKPSSRSQVILNLAKKHDGWKLECYSQNAGDEGFPTAVNRSIVVQFQMRPDDTCPGRAKQGKCDVTHEVLHKETGLRAGHHAVHDRVNGFGYK
ncbi:hypothetical protein EVAR_35503_1 [Eumeta japonica]|uniref:Uncharacterized protein n=1 Tax=Eumeta variegata TaxID=151549 RepID=A0A4C1X8Q9_EUMVA|nr:hypothetical protein EVAR_35503_1 [Eumeta japonica]